MEKGIAGIADEVCDACGPDIAVSKFDRRSFPANKNPGTAFIEHFLSKLNAR